MSGIDWPASWERTPSDERAGGARFQASLGQTTKQIAGEMDRMGVDEWRASTASGGGYTKRNGLPKARANPDDPGFVLRWTDDGQQFAVACDAYRRLEHNVRAVYLWINETRMRGQRPVKTGDTEFAAARLPSGDEDAIATGPPPHEILGVQPDAPDTVIKAAAKERIKGAHPDQGGSGPELRRVKDARDQLLSDS